MYVLGGDSTCYLCDKAITPATPSVAISRLGLRLHVACYERDLGVRASATDRRPSAQADGGQQRARRDAARGRRR